jgi:hypothetical protein
LLQAKKITLITLGTDKIQKLNLKSAFNCTQQPQKSCLAQPARLAQPLALGKKPLATFLFLLQTNRRQSINNNKPL